MARLDSESLEVLEEMVDDVGMPEVISGLEQIAWAKEEHVLVNWQDKELARAWARVAKLLDKFQPKLEKVYPD